jgi:hypothetical protein
MKKHRGFEPKEATHIYMVEGKQLGQAIVTETASRVDINFSWRSKDEPPGVENWVDEILESYCRNKLVFLEGHLFYHP